jgi:hypothetical protein
MEFEAPFAAANGQRRIHFHHGLSRQGNDHVRMGRQGQHQRISLRGVVAQDHNPVASAHTALLQGSAEGPDQVHQLPVADSASLMNERGPLWSAGESSNQPIQLHAPSFSRS